MTDPALASTRSALEKHGYDETTALTLVWRRAKTYRGPDSTCAGSSACLYFRVCAQAKGFELPPGKHVALHVVLRGEQK